METLTYVVLVPMVYGAAFTFLAGVVWRVWGIMRRPAFAPTLKIYPERRPAWLHALHDAAQHCIDRDLALAQDAGGALDTLIHRLRRKLRPHGDPIRTIYGQGFAFEGELRRVSSED